MVEVELSGIRKSYAAPDGRGYEALRGIDLRVGAGERFSLLGPSGCGKSTLLRVVAGLERPDAGRVTIGGEDATDLPPERRPTAMVFQNYALFPHLTVEGNVGFGLRLRRLARAEIARKVDRALEIVQLSGLNRRRMGELSGGQQQRVALARALVVEPAALLMDEPLSNLDASLRRSTRAAIQRIQSDLGLTLIYVTHDQEEALMISDRLALMSAGRIAQSGSPRELYEAPVDAEAARFLGQRSMIEAVLRGVDGDGGCALSLEGEGSAGAETEARTARPARIDPACAPGAKVWIAIKPDDVEIVPATAAGDGGWPAVVRLVSFAGAALEVEAELQWGRRTIRASVPLDAAGESLKRGDAVRVSLASGRGLVYPRG